MSAYAHSYAFEQSTESGAFEVKYLQKESFQSNSSLCTVLRHHTFRRYVYFNEFDPQPDVPMGMNPMAQCAFEILVLNVSAIRTS